MILSRLSVSVCVHVGVRVHVNVHVHVCAHFVVHVHVQPRTLHCNVPYTVQT